MTDPNNKTLFISVLLRSYQERRSKHHPTITLLSFSVKHIRYTNRILHDLVDLLLPPPLLSLLPSLSLLLCFYYIIVITMTSWYKIARPFLGHFLLNFIKTILGSGMVGYGIAKLRFHLLLTSSNTGGQQEQQQQEQDPSTSKYPDKNANQDNQDIQNNNKEESSPTLSSSSSSSSSSSLSTLSPFYIAYLERYVGSFVLIGVGLYLSLPSLASQMVWETAIPAITATEVAQDLATGSVVDYIKSWKPEPGNFNYWPIKSTTTTILGNNDTSAGGGNTKHFASTSSN
jgi:hypothetical protein